MNPKYWEWEEVNEAKKALAKREHQLRASGIEENIRLAQYYEMGWRALSKVASRIDAGFKKGIPEDQRMFHKIKSINFEFVDEKRSELTVVVVVKNKLKNIEEPPDVYKIMGRSSRGMNCDLRYSDHGDGMLEGQKKILQAAYEKMAQEFAKEDGTEVKDYYNFFERTKFLDSADCRSASANRETETEKKGWSWVKRIWSKS